ncbi:MAG: NAD(P)H-binding protein [Acidimicrobiia bacterium]|nr:NAD(P)H-binding protein [Acidimicrobiia bacterium]
MIALLGATGYTGKLVAAELARRGVPHRLGARSPEKLAALRSDAEHFVLDVGESTRLDTFLDGATALISTVGPFVRLGWPAVEAAARNNVAYVDSTGEQRFMATVYERFADAPVPIVPACGFDFIPSDLAAAVAMAALGSEVSEIAVHTQASPVPSRGTARTTVEMAEALSSAAAVRRVPFPDGVRTGVEFPFGDVPLARHAGGARVVTTMVLPSAAAPVVRRLSGLLPRLGPLVDRLPEGPSPRMRSRARFRVLAEALGPGGRAAVLCQGHDVYGLTARFLVAAALKVADSGAASAGAKAPAEALDPVPFLDGVTGEDEHGAFSWRRLEP